LAPFAGWTAASGTCPFGMGPFGVGPFGVGPFGMDSPPRPGASSAPSRPWTSAPERHADRHHRRPRRMSAPAPKVVVASTWLPVDRRFYLEPLAGVADVAF